MSPENLSILVEYLGRFPAILPHIATSDDEAYRWIKKHPIAWHTIQELGPVANHIYINDRLPTRFYQVSPPPYLNGGPEEFLSWVIESTEAIFSPKNLQDWLESRLPDPADEIKERLLDEEE